MKMMETATLTDAQKSAVMQLWNEEYPVQLDYKEPAEFDHYLDSLTGQVHLLAMNDLNQIIGWALTFDREGERWFAIILYQEAQHKGYGTAMLSHLKAGERKLAGWVIDHDRDVKADGTAYISPLRFYIENGSASRPHLRPDLKMLSAVRIEWVLSEA